MITLPCFLDIYFEHLNIIYGESELNVCCILTEATYQIPAQDCDCSGDDSPASQTTNSERTEWQKFIHESSSREVSAN